MLRPVETHTHLALVSYSHHGIAGMYDRWKEDGHIDSFLLMWTETELLADDGTVTNAGAILELPGDRAEWKKLIVDAVKKTLPYALLLSEQRDKEVVVILETTQGTHCWALPIQDHGDRKLLGKAVQSANKENIGILWKPDKIKGQA